MVVQEKTAFRKELKWSDVFDEPLLRDMKFELEFDMCPRAYDRNNLLDSYVIQVTLPSNGQVLDLDQKANEVLLELYSHFNTSHSFSVPIYKMSQGLIPSSEMCYWLRWSDSFSALQRAPFVGKKPLG